tara:strand:+ start:1723 stop:2193 length:471 start_codon:yes stop_codon:yes gene_type:complete
MKLQLLRISSQEDSTNGILFEVTDSGRKFLSYTLEDEHREKKIKGETRIPDGEYKITLRTVGGFHEKYKNRFKSIHKGMLWLRDIPNFKYVLLHCGNTDEHTGGCILVGKTQTENKGKYKDGFIGRSTEAYFDVYPPIAEALERGEEVTITVTDLA